MGRPWQSLLRIVVRAILKHLCTVYLQRKRTGSSKLNIPSSCMSKTQNSALAVFGETWRMKVSHIKSATLHWTRCRRGLHWSCEASSQTLASSSCGCSKRNMFCQPPHERESNNAVLAVLSKLQRCKMQAANSRIYNLLRLKEKHTLLATP